MTVSLLGPAEVRDLAELLNLQPTKKLGQNFVVDGNTVRRIVSLAGVTADDVVVEVGPGLGSLTLGILATGAETVAVEIDQRLARQLPQTVAQKAPDARLHVLAQDALTVDTLPVAPSILVANLPYNVSVPVLLHLLERVPSLDRALVMVQAEVGHRIAAPPNSKVYGSPSVKAAWYGDWRVASTVSRQIFWPVPNVDSVLVGFSGRRELGTPDERRRMFAIVDAAFGQRRKMLRQSLSGVLGGDAVAVLEAAGVAPTARGETLDVHAFLAIARASMLGR